MGVGERGSLRLAVTTRRSWLRPSAQLVGALRAWTPARPLGPAVLLVRLAAVAAHAAAGKRAHR